MCSVALVWSGVECQCVVWYIVVWCGEALHVVVAHLCVVLRGYAVHDVGGGALLPVVVCCRLVWMYHLMFLGGCARCGGVSDCRGRGVRATAGVV